MAKNSCDADDYHIALLRARGGVNTTLLYASSPFNATILEIGSLGALGVDIFILITGFFMVESEWHLKKLLKLIAQVWTYSVGIFAVFVATGMTDFGIKSLIKVMLPTTFYQYWFFTCYIALFVISPLLNKAAKAMSRRNYLLIIMAMLFMWSVLPTFTTRSWEGNEFTEFMMLYLIGGYIRLYPDCRINNIKTGRWMAIISAVLMFASTIVLNALGSINAVFSGYSTHFYNRSSVLVIALALGLLIVASNKKPSYNRIVNEIAACTFGVYLIHDNNYVREVLWSRVFHTTEWAASSMMIVHMIATVLVVFISCTIVEMGRRKLVEVLYVKKLNAVADRVENIVLSVLDKRI